MEKKVMVPFLRSAYNYDRNAASDESGLMCLDESRTKQSFAEEVDINTIMRKFGQTGKLPDAVVLPTYQDFEGIFDFHTAMNAVAKAGEAFDKMPAEVRVRFNNDPGAFVDFVSDDANIEQVHKWGLTSPEFEEKLAARRRAEAERAKNETERIRMEERREGAYAASVGELRERPEARVEQGAQPGDRGAPGKGGRGDS